MQIYVDFEQPKNKWRFDPVLIAIFIMMLICCLVIWVSVARAEEESNLTMSINNLSPTEQQEIEELNFWDDLVSIVIQIESSGNPYAVSKDGCIGLMQISRAVYEEYTSHNKTFDMSNADYILFNPGWNKEIGTWYLKQIWEHYLPYYKIPRTIDNLLWAYNAGIGNVAKGIKPKETQNYIKKYHKLAKEN